ncbi:MAG: hypothetical protein V7721_10975 [Porticoccaceae bacterium]
MSNQSFVNKIRTMSDSELDKELMSHEINDTGRMIILNEISMRNSRDIVKKVPWYAGLAVVISVLALAIAVISNWQELVSWFGA